MTEAATANPGPGREDRAGHDPARAHARCAGRKGLALPRPKPTFAAPGSWAAPMPGPTASSNSLVDHDNLSDDDDVAYPESYAEFQRRGVVREGAAVRTVEAAHRRPSRAARTGRCTYELSPDGDRTRLVLTHSGIASPVPARRISGAAGTRT